MIIRYNIQDDNINTVLTSGSMVYAGTDTGLNIINLDNIERSFVTTPTPITCLVKNGNLIYAGSLDGVYEIDVETQVITNYFTSLYKQHISALAWAGGSLWIAYYNELNDSDTVDKVTKFDVTTQVSAEYLNTNYGNFNTTTGLLENGGKLYLFDNYCLTEMTLAGVITNTYYPLGTSKPEVNFKFDVYGNTLYMAIAIPANKELKITEFDLSLFTSVSTYSLYSEISNAPTHIENLVLAGNVGIAGDGTISGGLLVTSLYVPDGGLYKLMPNTCNVIDAATVFLGVFTSRQTWGALVSTSTTNELALTELTAVIGPQQVTGKSGNVYSTKQSGLVVKANADRKSTRLNSSHTDISRMPSSA